MIPSSRGSAQLDAIRLSQTVRQRLVDYSLDAAFTSSDKLRDICKRLWSGDPRRGGLVSDLWIEGSFPSRPSSSTLRELADQGMFDPELCELLDGSGAFPHDRPLYVHQRESLHCASATEGESRPAVVVSAGTGAGKTECFLLPVLNDLYRRRRTGRGIQCLILYPMNALVNDQVDRLYDWLRCQDRVTLFHFTSETPENKRTADKLGVPHWEPCRFRTRDEARGREPRPCTGNRTPVAPDILVTNYSMLEYMLCRPQDSVFFDEALRAVVLDEAHLYTGTLAAEITLLLRRLYARCRVDPEHVLQIATSATLGRGAQQELRSFAATIFSKSESLVRVIVGEQARAPLGTQHPPAQPPTAEKMNACRWLDSPLLVADATGEVELMESEEQSGRLRDLLPQLTSAQTPDGEIRPAVVLHASLRHAPIVHRLEEILWQEKRLPLRKLAKQLWNREDDETLRATITLLTLTAGARLHPREFPLIPHRIHLVVRPPEGLSICLNEHCSADPAWKLPPFGAVAAGVCERCRYCGSAMLALVRCSSCGEALLAGRSVGARYVSPGFDLDDATFFAVSRDDGAGRQTVLCAHTAEVTGAGASGIGVIRVTECPNCGDSSENFTSFASGDAFTGSIVAETVLAELPEYPASHNAYLPARGRRLLAFSDSRREAARLGPRLRLQHEDQLIRSAIYHCLSEHTVTDEDLVQYLQEQLNVLENKLGHTSSEAVRRHLIRERTSVRQKLETALAGGSIEHWAEQLGRVPWLTELLDVETSSTHHAVLRLRGGQTRPWSQRDWEKNAQAVRSNTLELLAREFLVLQPRATSLETLGMAEVVYPGLDRFAPPDDVLGRLESSTRKALQACWSDLVRSLCDTLRMSGCVTIGGTDPHDRSYTVFRVPVGQWMSARHRGPYLVEWVGQTSRGRRFRFVRSVLLACGCLLDDAEHLAPIVLKAVFDQLLTSAGRTDGGDTTLAWLKRDTRQCDGGAPVDAIQIDFSQIGIRLPTELYRCRRTRRVWPRSTAGCAPEMGCQQTLKRVSPQELDADPRVGRLRREYRDSPVFRLGLWAEEHSAQLDPKENRRLQDLFKAGLRNILSATTTLELGIDIGGLAAVFLSNVPPGKANYLQRAGRAGRRSDGSAAVITHARIRPFDQEVFHRFGDYLDRPLRKPLVFLDRERLPRRHFHALLLGEFFLARTTPQIKTGAMEAFGKMGEFCGTPAATYWKSGSARPSPPESNVATDSESDRFLTHLREIRQTPPPALETAVTSLFRQTTIPDPFEQWTRLIDGAIEAFSRSIRDWMADFERLYRLWRESVEADQMRQANALWYQLRTLRDMTVIEALADRQFLPRYGFPIGVHRLQVLAPEVNETSGVRRESVRTEDQFRLERAGILSLAEYVPGSQLIVGGRQVTSRGLLKHWSGLELDESPGLRGSLCHCVNNHVYYGIGEFPEHCPICQGALRRNPEPLLFVKYGFTTAAWDPPKWKTSTTYVGSPETLTITFRQRDARELTTRSDFADVPGLVARYREDGELLVYHRGKHGLGFAVCLKCGFADSERGPTASGRIDLPQRFQYHAPLRSPKASRVCWQPDESPPVLRNQMLAARTTTDVLLLDPSESLGKLAEDRAVMWALAYACHRAATDRLELDSRELGVLLVPTGPMGRAYGAVLYDNVPGGAGHVRELLEEGHAWLEAAANVLFIDDEHDRTCQSGCLDCLLSFEAQRMMAQERFDRRGALRALTRLLR